MKKKKLLGSAILISGLCLLIFPFASMIQEDLKQAQADQNYSQMVEKNKKALDDQYLKISQTELNNQSVQDIFTQDKETANQQKSPYDAVLDTNQAVGRLNLPSIGHSSDLYLDADYTKLDKGVATLVGTGAPIGKKGQRPVIAGHRLIYNSMSFNLLPDMQKGDKIYINFLGKDLVYEVYSTEIISEYDSDKLAPIENKDVITLMTCYNAPDYDQRYLVNAQRVETRAASESAETASVSKLIFNKHIKATTKAVRLAPYFIVTLASIALLFFLKKTFGIITEK